VTLNDIIAQEVAAALNAAIRFGCIKPQNDKVNGAAMAAAVLAIALSNSVNQNPFDVSDKDLEKWEEIPIPKLQLNFDNKEDQDK